MTENKKRDSLHYFMSYDDLSGSSSSSSSSESEDEGHGSSKRKRGTDPAGCSEAVSHQGSKRAASESPLPKPDDLFKSVSKPTFLYNPLNKHIDWESRIVKAPEEPAKEFKAWKTNAVPPPQTYATEKKGAPPGMDMAIKWSNVYEDNGEDAPKPTTGNACFLPDEEKPFQSDEEQEQEKTLSAKKRKVESFQQKEKRKRDLGQATSDKSFVEEEKRILRQSIE